jgi:hypothetical protein
MKRTATVLSSLAGSGPRGCRGRTMHYDVDPDMNLRCMRRSDGEHEHVNGTCRQPRD